MPDLMVSVTPDPKRTAPPNSHTEATNMACRSVRALAPTDVPKALATSLAPAVMWLINKWILMEWSGCVGGCLLRNDEVNQCGLRHIGLFYQSSWVCGVYWTNQIEKIVEGVVKTYRFPRRRKKPRRWSRRKSRCRWPKPLLSIYVSLKEYLRDRRDGSLKPDDQLVAIVCCKFKRIQLSVWEGCSVDQMEAGVETRWCCWTVKRSYV